MNFQDFSFFMILFIISTYPLVYGCLSLLKEIVWVFYLLKLYNTRSIRFSSSENLVNLLNSHIDFCSSSLSTLLTVLAPLLLSSKFSLLFHLTIVFGLSEYFLANLRMLSLDSCISFLTLIEG